MKLKLILDNKTRSFYQSKEIINVAYKVGRIKYAKLKLFTIVYLDILNTQNLAKIKTRCFITCRSAAIYQKFQISRIKFRELVNQGLKPGLKTSSW